MPVITFHVSADNGPKQYLKNLKDTCWNLQKADLDTDLVLVSGEHQVRVHRAVLLPASPLLQDLVPPSSCLCSTPAVTLPQVEGEALAALVEVIYTGRGRVETKKAMEDFVVLTEILQMRFKVYCEKINSQEGIDPGVNNTTEKDEDESAAAITNAVVLRPREEPVTVKSVVETFFKGQTWVASNANGDREKDFIAEKKNREEAIRAKEKNLASAEKKNANEEGKAAARNLQIEVVPASTAAKKREKMEKRAMLEETSREDEAKQTQPNVETNQNKGFKSSDILDKPTRYQKRKLQRMLNISDEFDMQPQPKRKRLELRIQHTPEESGFVNIKDIIAADASDTNDVDNDILAQDPIKVHGINDSFAKPHENSETFVFSSEKPSFREEIVDSKDDGDREGEMKESGGNFSCPFCQKQFYKKASYDKHLAWNHFKEEICEQFPGLECMVCTKRFVKESNYVFHLGSFHKLADGLMSVAFASKMAQVNECNRSKSLAYGEVPSTDHLSVDSPRASQNNTRTRRSLGKEASESGTKSDNHE